jgi:hypothetical protein
MHGFRLWVAESCGRKRICGGLRSDGVRRHITPSYTQYLGSGVGKVRNIRPFLTLNTTTSHALSSE